MHGNVYEWTASPWKSYSEDVRKVDPATLSADLAELVPRALRVFRGGSCWLDPRHVRSAFRNSGVPWFVGGSQGFRVFLPCAPSGH
jgi:formylglycine-generating enzyme required for sulfatase activity